MIVGDERLQMSWQWNTVFSERSFLVFRELKIRDLHGIRLQFFLLLAHANIVSKSSFKFLVATEAAFQNVFIEGDDVRSFYFLNMRSNFNRLGSSHMPKSGDAQSSGSKPGLPGAQRYYGTVRLNIIGPLRILSFSNIPNKA
jgi:hypothetical protein